MKKILYLKKPSNRCIALLFLALLTMVIIGLFLALQLHLLETV